MDGLESSRDRIPESDARLDARSGRLRGLFPLCGICATEIADNASADGPVPLVIVGDVPLQIVAKRTPGGRIACGERADKITEHIGDHIFSSIGEGRQDC